MALYQTTELPYGQDREFKVEKTFIDTHHLDLCTRLMMG